jgi:hypothetical protein
MPTDNECLDYARECARLAALVHDQIVRDRLFAMAREWMAIAMHEEKLPQPVARAG